MTVAHDLLGKRFEFCPPKFPDFTVVSVDTSKDDMYVHAYDGGKHHLTLSLFWAAYKDGAVRESLKAGFTLMKKAKRVM